MTKKAPLVMIPGPTPVAEPVRQAMAVQTYGHNYSGFVEIYRECLNGLKTIFQADHMVVIGGSGTLAMEMTLINTVKAGQDLLVVSHGAFGDRFAAIAKVLGINADVLSCPPGSRVPLAEIEKALASKRYAALTLTHVDTSTGVLAQAKEVGELAKKYDVLYILDGVCASAGVPEPMKEYGIDVIVTTCQKAFGTPPGLTMIAFNEKAAARRDELGTVPGYYTDWKNWMPIMENPSLYISTPPVNHIVALNEAVKLILAEGLAARYARHERIGRSFRAGLAALGLETVTEKEALAPTLSVVKYPPNVDDAAFRAKVEENGVFIAGALGPLKGKAFRVGHMGIIGMDEIAITLTAIERALAALGVKVTPGAAVGAAWQEWDSVRPAQGCACCCG
ncbi:pyridoxal-phosphate-dependent aminotransferase family protein [Sporolituus thermophilus]|uniref:Aspartate aminotransferase n=1 Tax=Sporolituus thermophilus DSM 23256 TaxID=1123285 RepID=A0A1G7JWJ9_9FIRM|nr:alanine--glyoxylate aminotransferase family protein [Sporolituus thermophilus]SDF29327.1 aspartate aminotransferase [Sporolituus thermophilus DSM 23256]